MGRTKTFLKVGSKVLPTCTGRGTSTQQPFFKSPACLPGPSTALVSVDKESKSPFIHTQKSGFNHSKETVCCSLGLVADRDGTEDTPPPVAVRLDNPDGADLARSPHLTSAHLRELPQQAPRCLQV